MRDYTPRDDAEKAFETKHKCMEIIEGQYQNLQISCDYDTNPEELRPVLLFTPDMNNTINHHHIELTRSEALRLWCWLDEYFRRY